nr:replication protein A 70 kDa DNA-binding subunit A-like [Ipomoea batatas]GME09573.1 replication protein A 70 kDa DNA-binding subunit A-like [Ipomoea batatas]
MAPMYIVVREIKKNKTSAAMKLRAVRTYDVLQSRGNEEIKSRECVFHDHEILKVHLLCTFATPFAIKLPNPVAL